MKLVVFDSQGEEITYDKEIPEYDIINTELLNPDYIGYKILVDNQPVKNGNIKEPKKLDQPLQTNTAYPMPQALENNAMQFMFQMMQQSNSLLAESQRANMQAMLEATTKNAEAQNTRNIESIKGVLEIEQLKNKNALEMQEKKFLFEIEKRETMDALGKDKTTITEIIKKGSEFLQNVPSPIWQGIYYKLTGQTMPEIGNVQTSSIVDSILEEANE
ncbi:MAG: hypothetical protein IPO06_29480 [Leptospiraceae bacterium]|nr:hypothetical protein [Leptospiraceae bacterium]MBK9503435.1 hypothetical protein [Leptospiraceae bacterium]